MNINSAVGNLGDNLWLTPLFKYGIAKKIIMVDNKVCRSIAKIFEGIADVEYGNPDEHCPKSPDKIHKAAAHLKYFGNNKSCIPFVKLKETEIEQAKIILKDIKNPIAVNFTTSSAGADWCASQRVMNQDQINFLVNNILDLGFTPVNIGLSYNTKEISGVVNILDLDLRLTAACYHIIGKYTGTETGCPHLMLAVGGRILVYHPNPCDICYQTWKYHFTEEYWIDEPCRAKYENLSELKNIKNHFSFLLT
jgi:hypothetical protein